MGTTRLYLFRHGAVAQPYAGGIYGDLDVPLSDRGEAESEAAAATLEGVRLEAILHSGLQRARHLAAALAASREGQSLVVDERLREIHRGLWAGRPLDELEREAPVALAAWKASKGLFAPPGGETVQQVASRVVPALREIAERYAGGAVAIAAHLWVLRSAACACENGPRLQHCVDVDLPTGAGLVLDWDTRTGARPRRVLAT